MTRSQIQGGSFRRFVRQGYMTLLSHPSRQAGRATLLAGLAVLVLAAFASAADANPITLTALQTPTTGTAPFDGGAGPGQDASGSDDQVRAYDTVTYPWTINVNSDVSGPTEDFDAVTFVQTLPTGLSWTAGDIPAYCKGSGWSIVGRTLTCVYAPSGGGHTGSALNITLTAHADGVPDDTVATAAAGSASSTVTAGAFTSVPATSAAPAVTIRAAPWLDMFKRTPAASIAPSGDPLGAGYYLAYPIGVQIPPSRQSSYGRRGFQMPAAPVTFTDTLTGISPNAQFVSCAGSVTCVDGGSTVAVSIPTLPADPDASGAIASGTITVFVPAADVPAGTLTTHNVLSALSASTLDAHGTTLTIQGEDTTNNDASYNLITTGGSGNVGFRKSFLAADGSILPTQLSANDGNGQVLDGQNLLAELRIANNSSTAPAPTPGVCDVWDATRIHLAASAAHGGAAVWPQTVPGGWVAGTDYVVEYGTQAKAIGSDSLRWSTLQTRSGCTDASDTWTTSAPADLSTVTKVRIRLINDMAPAAATVVFRLNMVVDDTTDGDIVANFLGTRVATTWSASTYDPATNASFDRGDRVMTNGITVRVRKRAISPAVAFGTPATILSGDPIQFELTPTVTALDIGTGPPAAHGVVVRDRLPLGLTFDASQPTGGGVTPVVSTDGSGRQVLTWTIPVLTRGSEPTLTFWAQSSATTIGTRVNEAIIASSEDLGALSAFPGSPITDQHYSNQTVTLQSPGGVRISKRALQAVVEPIDPLAFEIEYANLTASTVSNVDVIDVLPFAGDGVTAGSVPGRVPATAMRGTLPIASIDVTHAETIRYTDADPATIYASSSPATTVDASYGALPGGKAWCFVADFGTAGCPVDLASATAVRIVRASLASGDSAQVTLHFAPVANASGDVYSNTAAIRYGSGNLGALSNVATSRVVASSIGDFVWYDRNGNGVQDAGEPPVAGVPITLSGTDKHGRAISVDTTTDAAGAYRFTSSSQAGQDAAVTDLVSGSYTVTFHKEGLPAGMVFTRQHAGGATVDSDADPSTGVATVTLPDPSPTGADGQDLTIDAGIVDAPPAAKKTAVEAPPAPAGADPAPVADRPAAPASPAPAPTADPKDPATLTVVQRASRRSIEPGKTIVLTIVVGNSGDVAARGTEVCTTIAAGLVVPHVPKGARFRDGELCWSVGTLQGGKTRRLQVRLRATAGSRGGAVTNGVRVAAHGIKGRTAKPAKVTIAPRPGHAGGHAGVTG